MDKPRFVLTIEATPKADAGVYRDLRRLLKALLRTMGFRCVSIEEVTGAAVDQVANAGRESEE